MASAALTSAPIPGAPINLLDTLTPADFASIRRCAEVNAFDGDSEDLMQEALLKAHLNQHKFRGQSALATWVKGFVENIAHNRRTVEFGRKAKSPLQHDTVGRKNKLAQYVYEYKRLNLPHGRRIAPKNPNAVYNGTRFISK